MQVDLLILDNFYNDPDAVRDFALKQDFSVTGNFPGFRTKSMMNDSIKTVLARALMHPGGVIIDWKDNPDSYSGSFQICTKDDKTWVHADQYNRWSGVCYLTPNAPSSSGTAFYRHKETGETRYSGRWYDWQDYSQWEQIEFIANKYNRLILYRGDLFHAAVNYFGDNLENGRLFQVFFIDTEF